MHDQFDPVWLLLAWPVARAVTLLGAAAVNLWSRNTARRSEARRLLRLLTRRQEDE